jgi:hypothetical protein
MNELEEIWKEVIVAYSSTVKKFAWRNWGISRKI